MRLQMNARERPRLASSIFHSQKKLFFFLNFLFRFGGLFFWNKKWKTPLVQPIYEAVGNIQKLIRLENTKIPRFTI
jgi:hypothetical protein